MYSTPTLACQGAVEQLAIKSRCIILSRSEASNMKWNTRKYPSLFKSLYMQIQFENAHCWQENKEDAETVPRLTLESLLLHLSTSFICSLGFLFMNSQLVHVLIIEVTQGCSGHPFAFTSPLVLKEAKANDWCEQPLLAWLKNWPRNETNNKLRVTAFKRGCLTSARLENVTTSQVSPVSQRKLNCSPVLF